MKLSDIARPPIRIEETENAPHSICPFHNGLVRETGDVDGKVMFCPIGGQFWRFSKRWQTGFNGPLHYRHEKAV